MTWVWRLHGQNWNAGANVPIVEMGGYGVSYLGGNGTTQSLFFVLADTVAPTTGNCDVVIGTPSDIMVKITRDLAYSIDRAEVFNTQTGGLIGTCNFNITGLASGSAIAGNGIQLGGNGAASLGGNVAFMRWDNTITAPGQTPFTGQSAAANIADYEFDGALGSKIDTNRGGYRGQNLSGTLTYANTPAYSPSCNAGFQQTVQPGGTLTIDGSASFPLDGGAALTFAWTYFTGTDGVNQNPTITNASSATTTVTGLNTFGSADFQLVVTDGSMQSTTCTIHDGVVPILSGTTATVDMAAEGRTPAQIAIAGPLPVFGKNTWPWIDNRMVAEVNLQAGNLTNYYTPYWRTFAAGTVSLSNGSATVVGTGTAFQALFCGGGTSPVNQAQFMWSYAGTDNITHYTEIRVASCTDDTHLVLASAYPASPAFPWPSCSPCSGLSYREVDLVTVTAAATWLYNAAPGNYYDNVMAFKTCYWRSGFDTCYTWANTAATYWLELPNIDYFYNLGPFYGNPAPQFLEPGRTDAPAGIILQEQDGHPELLPGLEQLWSLALYELTLENSLSFDTRDASYFLSWASMCALIDPSYVDAHTGASCVTNIQNSLPIWTTAIKDANTVGFRDFAWLGAAAGTSITSILGGAGSVSVTNGSKTVTGAGTAWSSIASSLVNNVIWIFDAPAGTLPADNTHGDPVPYFIQSVNSDTSLTLYNNYTSRAGTTPGLGFVIGNSSQVVGWGGPPVFVGLLGIAFDLAAKADPSDATTFNSLLDDAVQWIIQYGITPDNGGLYNGSLRVGCIPPIFHTDTSTAAQCYGTANGPFTGPVSPSQSRTLSMEVIKAFARDYAVFGSSVVKATADRLMSQAFSKPGTGGPNPDGFYVSDFDVTGGFMNGTPPLGSAPKWMGEGWGWAEPAIWSAARTAAFGTAFNGAGTIRGNAGVR